MRNNLQIKTLCSYLHSEIGLLQYVPFTSAIFFAQLEQSYTKTNLHKIEVLQNNILRACFFYLRHFHVTPLYSNFKVLKLQDMFQMEIAKFMFKFNNQMLPASFNNYFIKLDSVHRYDARQKNLLNTFNPLLVPKVGK